MFPSIARRMISPAILLLSIALLGSVVVGCRTDRREPPGAGGTSFAPGAPPTHKEKPDQILVKFRPDTPPVDRTRLHQQLGRTVAGRLTALDVDVVKIEGSPRDAAARYRRNAQVEIAEPNFSFSIHATPDDPRYPGMWGLHNTGQNGGVPDADVDAPEAWDLAGVATGSPWPPSNIAVGVIDTGADIAHEDLNPRVIAPCFTSLGGTAKVVTGCADDNGHGTHVAGTVAAIASNGRGIVGAAPHANLFVCKALDASGSGWTSDIAACVDSMVTNAATYNIRVIAMSLGGPASAILQSAVDRAWAAGILVVAAAGNSGNTTINYPAGHVSVLSVAATDRSDMRASFSNMNDDVELAAPGVEIMSTLPNNGYQAWSGTSMATPHVAGIAALVSWKRGITGQPLRDALTSTADDLGPAGRDPSFGFGRVNACRALGGCAPEGAPATPTPAPTPTPTPVPSPTPSPTPAPTWTTVQQNASSVRLSGSWQTLNTSRASGRSYARSRATGNLATFTFTGTGVRWIGIKSTTAGITQVKLDGVVVAEVDAYASSTSYQQVLFERLGLAPGSHTLELVVTGRRNPRATYGYTFVDAFARTG